MTEDDVKIFDEPMKRNVIRFDDADPEEAALKFVTPTNPVKSVSNGNNVDVHHSARGNLKVTTIQGPADQPEKTFKPKPKAPRAKTKTTPKDPKITKAHQESLKEIGFNPPK